MIESICQNCGNKKIFSDDKSGKKYKCSNCNEVVIIEGIGTFIKNEYQANITNTYADSIEKAEKEKEAAERKVQYEKLLKKSKTWNGWGIAFLIFAGIAVVMVFSKDKSQIISVIFWGGLGLYFQKKSKEFKESAEKYNQKFANSSAVNSQQIVGTTKKEQPIQANTTTVSTENKKGILTIRFPGQWFLIDAKTEIFVNGILHSENSTKNGFNVEIPIETENKTIKVVLLGLRSTSFDLTDLKITKNYLLELKYDNTWGKYSDKPNLSEIS